MDKLFTMPVGVEPTEANIREAIEFNQELVMHYKRLDDYYLGQHEPILSRRKDAGLSNNKIITNHAKYITDINVGYLLGSPVDYQLTDDEMDDKVLQPVLDAYKRENSKDIDMSIAKGISKFGRMYEYQYVNKDGQLRSVPIDPRNAVIVYDDTFEKNVSFVVMYEIGKTDSREDYIAKATVLTDSEIIQYTEVNHKLVLQQIQTHLFGYVPFVDYWNNDELQGDYEQVVPLIDAYNFLQSDRVNDKEQLVEAILVLTNFDITDEQKAELKTYKMLANVPADGKVEYLTKALDESQIELLRASLEQDIHKISMTPNMSDENFVGNSSGVAIAYKLLPFEQSVRNKERGMETGLKERFKFYNLYLFKISKMELIDPSDIDVVFKRNLPKNNLEIAQMISYLKGTVSDETLITQLSFIEDASKEVEKAQSEGLQGMNAEVPEFGTPDATLETLEEKGLVEASAKQDSLLTKLKDLMSGQQA